MTPYPFRAASVPDATRCEVSWPFVDPRRRADQTVEHLDHALRAPTGLPSASTKKMGRHPGIAPPFEEAPPGRVGPLSATCDSDFRELFLSGGVRTGFLCPNTLIRHPWKRSAFDIPIGCTPGGDIDELGCHRRAQPQEIQSPKTPSFPQPSPFRERRRGGHWPSRGLGAFRARLATSPGALFPGVSTVERGPASHLTSTLARL